MLAQLHSVLPGSLLGQALHYLSAQWHRALPDLCALFASLPKASCLEDYEALLRACTDFCGV